MRLTQDFCTFFIYPELGKSIYSCKPQKLVVCSKLVDATNYFLWPFSTFSRVGVGVKPSFIIFKKNSLQADFFVLMVLPTEDLAIILDFQINSWRNNSYKKILWRNLQFLYCFAKHFENVFLIKLKNMIFSHAIIQKILNSILPS